MESIQVTSLLFEKEYIRMKAFLGASKKGSGDLVVKQYSCKSYEEADLLVKEAVRQAHDPYPLWVALADVFFHRVSQSDFTLNLVYIKAVADVPRDFMEKNDRVGTAAPGLSAYQFGEKLYERTNVSQPVIVRAEGLIGMNVKEV